jgi:hypothetical protein
LNIMNSNPTDKRDLGFVGYFDTPDLVPLEALETAFVVLQESGLDPDRYTIDPGHGSRRYIRRIGTIYTREQALEEVAKDDARGFFVQAIRGEEEQMISLQPSFPLSPFQSFGISSTSGQGIAEIRALVKRASRKANLAFGGSNEGGYLEWQRCAEPDYYEKKYGSIAGFGIIEEAELPPPLNRRLDISRNPGRISSVNKLPVFVAADMWLGPAFWKYAPCTKEEVLKEPWVEVEDTEHYLYLKAYPEPFTRPDGEQGRIQRRLWNVLFHQDCEWPP